MDYHFCIWVACLPVSKMKVRDPPYKGYIGILETLKVNKVA